MNLQNPTIAVIGLGYVSLPLAVGEEEVTDRQRAASVQTNHCSAQLRNDGIKYLALAVTN